MSSFRFGQFTVDLDRGALLKNDLDVPLRRQSFQVLKILVENHGHLVSRIKLQRQIWGDSIVTDDSLTHCLVDIRKAIGDADKTTIRTIPRRGFVFDAPVEILSDAHSVDLGHAGATRALRKTSPGIAVVFFIGAVLSGLALWLLSGMSGNTPPSATTSQQERSAPSIAVLPFTDLSAAQDQEYFANGMAEEVLSQLSHVQGLTVIALTSSVSIRNGDVTIADIASDFDVSHVLRGSVRRSADEIRASIQLIDAKTSEQIWVKPFNGEFNDVFAVQDEMSAAVVEFLELNFSEQLSPARIAPESYSLFLQAVYLLGQSTPSTSAKVESLLLEAIQIDSDNAPAWRELARLRWRRVGTGLSPQGDVEAVREAINRAISIDSDDPATLAYLAGSIGDFDGNIEKAARLYERAIGLDPSNEHVLRAGTIFLTNYGAAEDAIALGEYGILRNPVCFLCAHNLVLAYFRAGRFEEAESLARSVVSLHGRGHGMVAEALLLQGRPAEALEWYERVANEGFRATGKAMALFDLSKHAESDHLIATFAETDILNVPTPIHVWAYAWTGRSDMAFAAFERMLEFYQSYGSEAVVRQIPWQMSRVARSPFLTKLHDDPRWNSLARRTGISQAARVKIKLPLFGAGQQPPL